MSGTRASLLGRLDHVGLVVKDLEATAKALERVFGLELESTENYGDTLRIGFVPVGGCDLELIEPLKDEGPNAEFLREHGEGVHHLAFEVDDLEAATRAAESRGARVVLGPTDGARGRRIVFLAGDELGGSIVELCTSVTVDEK